MSNDRLLSDLATIVVVRDNLDLLYRALTTLGREVSLHNRNAGERLHNAASYVACAIGEVFAANCDIREVISNERQARQKIAEAN
jgi:hypothetical protein